MSVRWFIGIAVVGAIGTLVVFGWHNPGAGIGPSVIFSIVWRFGGRFLLNDEGKHYF